MLYVFYILISKINFIKPAFYWDLRGRNVLLVLKALECEIPLLKKCIMYIVEQFKIGFLSIGVFV